MNDPKSYDGLSSFVFMLGVYVGVVPFAGKLLGWEPDGPKRLLVFPLRLPGPAWWIVSVLAILVAFGLLCWIDTAKKRRFPG
ncbi:hypothetical protein [Actinomadura napierensis]|uniref:DUF3311 domain-containing protein n=1 Tax=Actinomadura napierensis TaxID=267854 RepID=A0ABN2ZZ00_9ACTN